MKKDPVCGMQVEHDLYIAEADGHKYHFCSEGCMKTFNDSPSKYSLKKEYDLVIIGGGPAGLTAAVYASISRIDTVLITSDIGGQAVDSTKIKNYMGFDFVSGTELTEKFQNQFLNEHYLAHVITEVLKIRELGDRFELTTKENKLFLAKAVIIATGMKKRKLGIPGEAKLVRKGVSYSAVQDIGLFKGLDIVVIGGGNSGLQTANDLSKIGCRVSIVTKGKMIADPKDIELISGNPNIKIFEGYDIIEIHGENYVEGVTIQAEESHKITKIDCKGVFIQVGFLPNTEFCKDIVDLNRIGEIKIQPDCSTNVSGIFACGDVTNAFGKRIVIASGEGAKAVLAARKFLVANKKETAAE